jgi:hypothetical protein
VSSANWARRLAKRQDRDAQDHARDHQRREHHQRQRLLAREVGALQQEGVGATDQHRQQRDPGWPRRRWSTGCPAGTVGKQAGALGAGIADEPVQREAAPGRRRVGRVIEGEHRHHHQRQEQEGEEQQRVDHGADAQPGGAGQRGDHALAHHFAELLAGQFQARPHDAGGQDQQQEAEGRTLFPVEAGDELGVDLLGEPQRVLAAQQRRRQVVAQRQHEHHDAAGHDARRRMRDDDLAQDRPAVAAQVVGGLDQRCRPGSPAR